jgi:hypothetical protein
MRLSGSSSTIGVSTSMRDDVVRLPPKRPERLQPVGGDVGQVAQLFEQPKCELLVDPVVLARDATPHQPGPVPASRRKSRQGGLMKRPSRDEEREKRITTEIVVDTYTPEEQAIGWYYSLEDRLRLEMPNPCGLLGAAGGHRGGRADTPDDRGLALLGRSRLRAVTNSDLEGGTVLDFDPTVRCDLQNNPSAQRFLVDC